MDYWQHVTWHRWPDWAIFRAGIPESSRLWFVESGGPQLYTDVRYDRGDYLVFGRETAGLPTALLEAGRETWVRIPMVNRAARSLNLANCAAIVLYEALRQIGFEVLQDGNDCQAIHTP